VIQFDVFLLSPKNDNDMKMKFLHKKHLHTKEIVTETHNWILLFFQQQDDPTGRLIDGCQAGGFPNKNKNITKFVS